MGHLSERAREFTRPPRVALRRGAVSALALVLGAVRAAPGAAAVVAAAGCLLVRAIRAALAFQQLINAPVVGGNDV